MKTIRTIAALVCAVAALASPVWAGTYPVSGRWGLSGSVEKGPIDCSKLRVISFNGSQRTDSKGGVPAYRNRTVANTGAGQYSVVDEFTTGQIGNAHVDYTLRVVDAETLELTMQPGGSLKLRKCK